MTETNPSKANILFDEFIPDIEEHITRMNLALRFLNERRPDEDRDSTSPKPTFNTR